MRNVPTVAIDETAVRNALDRIRPYIQRDGGDVELVRVDETRAHVRLVGACASCPSAAITLHLGIEQWLREQVPGLEGIVVA